MPYTIPLLAAWLAAAPVGTGVRIHVVSHGWHTGIVLPTTPELFAASPAFADFRPYRAVEVGWGDEGFYRADRIRISTALAAVFWPTPSVLHVVGVDRPVDLAFPGSDIVALDLTPDGFRRLVAAIGDLVDDPEPLGRGLYGPSWFFRAKGSYYFPKTCNVWTLRMLGRAGVPTRPLLGLRAPAAMAQVARRGEVIRMAPPVPRWPFAAAWLVGVLLVALRARRGDRRPGLVLPWLLTLLGAVAAAGPLTAAANGAGWASRCVLAGVALTSLALGGGLGATLVRMRRRRLLRDALTAILAVSWVTLLLAGA